MKTKLCATLALAAAFVIPASGPLAYAGRQDEDASKEKASIWMRQKLGASKGILEGMTRGDFASIENNARSMHVMGYLERWARADTEEYKEQLDAFEHASAAIIRAAEKKNLDGVTLGYTQLTIGCVQCHKLVRDAAKD